MPYTTGRRLLGAAPFPGVSAVLVVLGIFAATLLSGWLLYTCVEQPVMRRWARKRQRTVIPASTGSVTPVT